MNDAAALFSLYTALWRGEDVWADGAIAFTPYDSYAILRDKAAVLSHMRARLSTTQLVGAASTELAGWREDDVEISFRTLTLATRMGDAPEERRSMRLVLAGVEDENGAWKLVHVAEAMEAALLAMIGGYRAEAEGAPHG